MSKKAVDGLGEQVIGKLKGGVVGWNNIELDASDCEWVLGQLDQPSDREKLEILGGEVVDGAREIQRDLRRLEMKIAEKVDIECKTKVGRMLVEDVIEGIDERAEELVKSVEYYTGEDYA